MIYFFFFLSKRDLFVAYRGEVYCVFYDTKQFVLKTLVFNNTNFFFSARAVFSERVCLF